MSIITPAFVTNHEIDALLGGGKSGERRRQRLQKQGRLPAPQWLRRIDRFRVAVYPVFTLAGLLDVMSEADDARERLAAVSASVLRSSAYELLAEALRESARALLAEREFPGWEFGAVAKRLAELSEPVVADWEAVVHEATERLSPWGVLLSADFGSIEEEGNVYVVSLANRPAERFNRPYVAAGLHRGSSVGVEHVRVRGQALDFVMPALELHTTTAVPELDWSEVSASDWEEIFTGAQEAAATASFDRGYWDEPDLASSSSQFNLPAEVPSGREAARQLLTAQGR
jgi:hypothetical protein